MLPLTKNADNLSPRNESSHVNSLTAIDAHECQRFNKLRGTVVSC